MITELEEEVVRLLGEKELKLSFAESCTGGLVASRIVSVSGASKVFVGSLVTYSNEAKMHLLKVSATTIDKYTAVSKECAMEMAKGCRAAMEADIAVSITGYAGPLDFPEEPKGLVYIGCAFLNKNYAKEYRFTGDRNEIRDNAANKAIELVREILLNEYKGN